MPPRRSHTKSKAGCLRCKRRKIKCDEVHPRCGNCAKHGVPCDFSASPSSAASSPSLSNFASPVAFPGPSPAPVHSMLVPRYKPQTGVGNIQAHANHATTRALEFTLLHHYTVFTTETLAETKPERIAWQRDVPSLAYGVESRYLMDAILAVSALHLRVLNPDDQTFARASHSYMATSLAHYSSILRSGVSESNAEALFSTAALIAFQAAASRQFDADYTLPVGWFMSFQGIKTVVIASWQWLRSSDHVSAIFSSQPALALDLDPQRKSYFAPLLQGLEEDLSHEDESTRSETKHSLVHAVACLNWAHKSPDRSRILAIAATVTRRFVHLLTSEDPRTLVIVACFFAMIRAVDDVWWLQGVAKREVEGIFHFLPLEWRAKMEWPLSIVHHEGPLDEEVWGISWAVKEEISPNINTHIDLLAELMKQSIPVD